MKLKPIICGVLNKDHKDHVSGGIIINNRGYGKVICLKTLHDLLRTCLISINHYTAKERDNHRKSRTRYSGERYALMVLVSFS